ncbi:hypothetical protein RB195_016711 [Necator americanus]|uniref:G-protein coupled receptors family 1 profile domain-containing protein n=1 Tax=Necator americanus TaxID=51031 RepID=A0ABR1C1S1_NECAM
MDFRLSTFRLNQFQHQTSRRTIAIAVLINLAVIINYVVTVYVVMWPEDHFTRLVENTIKLHDLDITTVTFIGLSMKYGMNTLNIALMLDMIAVMVLMECIHFFCAKSINNFLKKSTKSRKSQSIHRQMLILLVVQIAMNSATYSVVIQVISLLSSVMNILLIFLYFRCPLKNMKIYKYVFILTAIQDLIASLSILLTVPRPMSRNSYLIFIAIGFMSKFPYGQVLLIIFSVMMCLSLVILANSFVYRYIHVCKLQYSDIYTRKEYKLIMCAVNAFLLLNCGIVMVECFWPNYHFREQLYSEKINIDVNALEEKSFLGFSKEHSFTSLTVVLMIDGLLMMVVFSIAGIYGAFRIRYTLKKTSMSEKTKNMHQKMFRILLVQCVCPILFLYAPICVCLVRLRVSQYDANVTDTIGIIFFTYPLLNPIVTISFVKDYRTFVISLVTNRQHIRRGTANSRTIGMVFTTSHFEHT